jgi:hypothetical protein
MPTPRFQLRRSIPLLLAAVPPAYLLIVILTYTVDVPFADQWALVPLLDRFYRGKLAFGDLWTQHNEHRLLFPRLAMLALARLTGWNTHAEMLLSVALAGGIFAVLLSQARASARRLDTGWRWLAPVLALIVFSLGQAESWWGGWNIQIFMSALAACAAIALLARPGLRWLNLLLALVCGVVATYSYAPGLLIWPVGLGLLLLQTLATPGSFLDGGRQPAVGSRQSSARFLAAVAWAALGGLAVGGFFYHYAWTAQAPSLGAALRAPGRYLLYTITYLGAPIARGAVEYLFGAITGDARAICNLGDSDLCGYVNTAAIAAGVLGMALFGLLALRLVRRVGLAPLLPYLGLGAYSIGTGMITSLGRAGYGNYQALAQRYATTASLFWSALVIMLALGGGTTSRRELFMAPILLISMLVALNLFQGIDHFRWQYEYLAPARAELSRLGDDDLLRRLYFDPQVVRRDAAVLRRYHLSVFR